MYYVTLVLEADHLALRLCCLIDDASLHPALMAQEGQPAAFVGTALSLDGLTGSWGFGDSLARLRLDA